jgi:putative CocE/NonD family hydrolase
MAEPSPVVVAGMRSMFNMVSCSSMHRAAYQGGAYRTELISGWLKWNKENYSIPTVLSHESADEYWRPTDQSIDDRWRSTDYPVMHLSGFYDIFSNEQIRDALMFDAVGGPNAVGNQLLVIEPGGHCKGGEVVWPNATWGRVITQLWQLTLYQRTIGNHQVEYRNPESLAIWYALGSGLPSESGNVWLRSNFVEFVNVTHTTWFLNGDGSLSPLPLSNEATSSTYIADPSNPITTYGGNVLTLPNCGPHDQQKIEASFANNMVVFTSAPLTQALFAHGMLSATLYVQSTAIDTDFNVKVTDVYPNTNQSMLIQDGVLRMRWRNGPDHVAPTMSSGQTYQIEVEIGWTSYVFSPGHRIRVAIASSNYPRFSLNLNNGEFVNGTSPGIVAKNTVVHDAMHLSALVIPSRPIEDLSRLAA